MAEQNRFYTLLAVRESAPFCGGWRRRFLNAAIKTLLAVSLMVGAAESFDSIYISEVLARRGVVRKHGTDDGWIELHNGGSSRVNLDGWFLSDSRTNLTKWAFPKVVMLPDSYLVISASGTGRTSNLADLEANFTLATGGGEIVLARGETNIVSKLAYPQLKAGVSYGSVRGEPAIRGNFVQPTPGKANQSRGAGFAPPVAFSHPSGSITSPIALALSCADAKSSEKVVIRYTLDGTLPNNASPVYREPLEVTNTTAVRARAYADGLLPGPPQSEVYLSLTSDARKFRSNLPLLVMNIIGMHGPPSSRSSYLSFYEPADGKSSLEGPPALVTRGGFHVRGSSTADMPQPSLAMEFLDEFDDDRDLPTLGMPANSDWVLYAPNVYDPVLIHNPFIHQLGRDIGRYSSRTRFVEVYLVLHPGPVRAEDYAGLYVLEEKIKIGKHRVAIDKLKADDLKEPDLTGGYLLKFDRTGAGEMGFWAGGAEMVYVDPKEQVINLPQRAAQRRYIANFLDEFDRALQGSEWKDPIKGYPAFIDVDAWIDFHVLETLSGNVDIFRYSTYFYKPRGGKLIFGPHWDFDRALGSIDRRDAYPRRWNTGRFFDGAWWRQVFQDPDFWQLWVDRWQALRRTHFSETNLFDLIDRLADEVREARPREAARWGLHPRGGSYQSEVDWMKRWLSERMDFIDNQLVQPPTLDHPGGEVNRGTQLTITGPPGATIYYTQDGSDPRQPQGGISRDAKIYSGPIEIGSEMRVMVRARNPEVRQTGGPPVSTPWSSPVSASFTIMRP